MRVYTLYVIEFDNGKRYFGITSKTIEQRQKKHEYDSRRGSMLPVHCAMRTHKSVMRALVIGCKDYILDLEIKAIEFFGTRKRSIGYNVSLGGEVGLMLSEEIKEKAVATAKRNGKLKGRKRSPETIAKIKASRTPEMRKKISEASVAMWANSSSEKRKMMLPDNTGIKRTEAQIAAMSARQTGSRRSAETEEKIQATRRLNRERASHAS